MLAIGEGGAAVGDPPSGDPSAAAPEGILPSSLKFTSMSREGDDRGLRDFAMVSPKKVNFSDAFFLGGVPQLQTDEVLFNQVSA